MKKKESVIRATYEILKHNRYSGLTTFIFRTKLRERLQEYNDEIIRDLEEILIEYNWVFKDKRSKVLVPTKKLISTAEHKLASLEFNKTLKIRTRTLSI
ncbi:MAG: hypothetical protein ACXVHS_00340 [Methanobacterium sp.]